MQKKESIRTEKKPDLKWLRDRDKQKVKGIFRFHEVPGGVMSFIYRMYKEDAPETFSLEDGKVYEIPLGVAKHLNTIGYPIHAYAKGEDDKPSVKIGKRVKRCSFQSLDFTEEKSLLEQVPDIVTVEYATK